MIHVTGAGGAGADTLHETSPARIRSMLRPMLVVATLLMLAAAPAGAKKDGKGHGNGHGNGHASEQRGKGQGDVTVVDVDVNIVFNPDQRVVYREYWGQRYGKKCPPGLAKKNNGCLPPGLAKKRYQVGHPLPHEIVIAPVPPELQVRIGVPPAGYLYGIIDGDLVKLAAGTLLVVDALDGLSQ